MSRACDRTWCHSGIEGHWCPTPADKAEQHDPAMCRACPVEQPPTTDNARQQRPDADHRAPKENRLR